MFQSCFAEQFVEANVLLFIKPERVLMTRRWGLLSGLVGQCSVCIHNIGKKRVATWERPRPRRASTFVGQMPICRTKVQLAPIWRWEKIRAGESLSEVFRIPRYSFRGWGCSRCNITTVGRRKKARRADWSGRERSSESRSFSRSYLAS